MITILLSRNLPISPINPLTLASDYKLGIPGRRKENLYLKKQRKQPVGCDSTCGPVLSTMTKGIHGGLLLKKNK